MKKKLRFTLLVVLPIALIIIIFALTKSTLGKKEIAGAERYYESSFGGVYYVTSYFLAECDHTDFYCFTEWMPIVKKVWGADADTLRPVRVEFLNSIDLHKDKNNVYYEGEALDYLDTDTLKYSLNDTYIDKNGVYFASRFEGFSVRTIEGADPESFNFLSQHYAVDSVNVFFISEQNPNVIKPFIIEGADPDTFEVMKDSPLYAKDKNKAYHWGKEVTGADPSTYSRDSESYIP